MNIVMVVPSMFAAGMEMVVARLSHGLQGRGHEIHIACLQELGGLGSSMAASGFPIEVVPTPGLWSNVVPTRLLAWIRRIQPDVVHVHSGVWLKGARAARQARVGRVIHTIHGLHDVEPWYGPALKRLAARDTDVIAAVSAPLANYLTGSVHLAAGKVVLVPNGIDTDSHRPGPHTGRIRDEAGWDPDSVVIGHVARFAPVKNHQLLLDAFAIAAESRADLKLALVGDGRLRTQAEARASDLGILDRVAFTGQLDDLPSVYRDFDVFTLPSLAEGTSMSILEAMAAGLTIVATAVGGTPAVLDHGRAGILIPSNDPAALAAGLLQAAADPELRQTLGGVARARAVSLYSQELMLDRYEELYDGSNVHPSPSG